MTIARFVVLMAGLAGFHPSKCQPLPGTQKLWEGVRFLSNAASRRLRSRAGERAIDSILRTGCGSVRSICPRDGQTSRRPIRFAGATGSEHRHGRTIP